MNSLKILNPLGGAHRTHDSQLSSDERYRIWPALKRLTLVENIILIASNNLICEKYDVGLGLLMISTCCII